MGTCVSINRNSIQMKYYGRLSILGLNNLFILSKINCVVTQLIFIYGQQYITRKLGVREGGREGEIKITKIN